jgi:hypothetical protein
MLPEEKISKKSKKKLVRGVKESINRITQGYFIRETKYSLRDKVNLINGVSDGAAGLECVYTRITDHSSTYFSETKEH